MWAAMASCHVDTIHCGLPRVHAGATFVSERVIEDVSLEAWRFSRRRPLREIEIRDGG